MPSLDVVIPCYNYGRFLERSARSALEQEGADVRVLIIDDCSSDDTEVVGRRLAGEDRRVEFRRHEANKGFVPTINEGVIGWARSEYTLLLSADDALVPGAFSRARSAFDKSSEIGLVYGLATIITHDDEARSKAQAGGGDAEILSGLDFLEYCCLSATNPVPSPTAFVRTDMQHRLGGYRSDMPHTCDLEMWMRFAANGPVGVVRTVQGEYRVHERNMSRIYLAKVIGDRRERAYAFRTAMTPLLDVHPKARYWLKHLHDEMLAEAFRNAVHEFVCGDAGRAMAWSDFFSELGAVTGLPNDHQHRMLLREMTSSRLWRLFKLARQRLNAGDPRLKVGHEEWAPKHGDIFGWSPGRGAET